MLMDIFSSFDEQNLIFSSKYLTWIFGSLIIYIFNSSIFWLKNSRMKYIMPLNIPLTEVKQVKSKKMPGFSIFISSLFMYLLVLNFIGLSPYIFSTSSHLVFAMSFSFPFWAMLILSTFMYDFKFSSSHLLPEGAPLMLSPFLVLVETISIIVRPLTLSIRLTANVGAGHIVLGLVGIYFSSLMFSWLYILLMIMFQIFYTLFEMAICFIQAYIFTLLLTLYSNEHS